MAEYPGQGHPWADFLHHRLRVIEEMLGEGKTEQEIFQAIQVDRVQVSLLCMTVCDRKDEREKKE